MANLKINPTEIGSLGPYKVIIGRTATGKQLILDRLWKPHTWVSGQTGSGKGGTIRVMQVHDVAVGNETIIVEPKPGEFGWTDGAATRVSEPQDVLDALAYVDHVLTERQAELGRTMNPETGTPGVDNFQSLPEPWHQIVVYIDEAPALFGDEALLDYNKEEIDLMARTVAKIVKRGRSAGVALVLVTQYPTKEGTFNQADVGVSIRANIPQRVHCDRVAQSLHAVFDSGKAIPQEVLAQLSAGLPGRIGYQFAVEGDGGAVKAGQVTWVTPSKAREFALGYDGPPVDQYRKLVKEFGP